MTTRAPAPPPTSGPHGPFTLHDAVRSALATLDSATASAADVRAALASAGIVVPVLWAGEWLRDRTERS
jgi:hypothetical protein